MCVAYVMEVVGNQHMDTLPLHVHHHAGEVGNVTNKSDQKKHPVETINHDRKSSLLINLESTLSKPKPKHDNY